MVKGISKRVVVVQPDDSAVFEQAIFIVRDGGRQDIIKEAQTGCKCCSARAAARC